VRRAVVWFRRDLSLGDNPAWAAATTQHDEVAAVFVVEPALLAAAGEHRRAQLLCSVDALARSLEALGGSLSILKGPAVTSVPDFARRIGAGAVLFNADVTRFAQARDALVVAALSRCGVASDASWGTLMHAPGTITTAAGSVPRVFTRFYERWASLPLEGRAATGTATLLSGPDTAELRVESVPPMPAGEAAALERLGRFAEGVDDYAERRDRPDLEGTSRLSADLRFGTISPRTIARRLGAATPGKAAFVRQLAWRDWYAHLFYERPDLVDHAQQQDYDRVEWSNDPDDVAAWVEGRTGYPIVDAAMRELAATGWLHNRLRMIAASFLVKDLLVDWRVGERHFRRLLVDGDVPQNAGNWQWSAGTGPDAAPYFRVMNPTTQGLRFDPHGDYVRRWVPELAALEGNSVHEPWELGGLELAAAGVLMGHDYPHRVIDHAFARARVLAAFAAARAAR